MAEDGLGIFDIEHAVLTGSIEKTETDDPRALVARLATELPALLAQPSLEATTTIPSSPFDATTINISDATAQLGPLAEGAISATLTIVTQFVLALAIFFFMIAAAMNLDKKTRKEIDPNAPVVGRISELTGGVQRYMTILTGINFLVALGNTIFLHFWGSITPCSGGCSPGSWGTSPPSDSGLPLSRLC